MNESYSPEVIALASTLLEEVGEAVTDENIDGLIGNHSEKDWDAAAAGDVVALIAIRTGCGLPFTR